MFNLDKKRVKKITFILKVSVAFFITLNMLNSYAVIAADTKKVKPVINYTKTYQESNDKNSNLFDMATKAARDNISKTVNNLVISSAVSVAQEVVPSELVEMSPEVRSELNNSGYNKSLFEFAGNNVEYALNNQMTMNIPEYMAMDWVPGYAANSENSVYAGNGYDYLKATNIADLWDFSRTIAYVLFIIIIIVAGFMIMFRNKIGGQMAVTVYNTLPNVILGLILVTFSFQIVGIVLNLSAILTVTAHSVLGIDSTTAFYPTELFSSLKYMVTGMIPSAATGWSTGGIIVAIVAVIALCATGIGGVLVLFLILIIFITYIIAFWNVWFTLFKAYLAIVIDTVAGPILLTLSVFPGNSRMMIEWFMRLARNALLFPIVFFILNAALKIAVDLDLNLTGLGNGTLDPTTSSMSSFIPGVMETFFKMMLPLAALFFCANVPYVLEELFPSQGSKGLSAALQGTQKGFAGIPLFGSLFAPK